MSLCLPLLHFAPRMSWERVSSIFDCRCQAFCTNVVHPLRRDRSMTLIRLESLRAQQRRSPSEATLRPLSESNSTLGSMGMQQLYHGLESEASALQWLEGCGFTVSCRSTVMCASEPWLSASPDRVLNSEELLEIKFPLLKSDESLENQFRSQRYDVRMEKGTPQLQPNGPRGFYMQVQLAMFCTGLRACKLLIWVPSQQVLLHVPYNAQFCDKTVARLKTFYFKYMLPHVSDEFQAGCLLLSTRYLQLCK